MKNLKISDDAHFRIKNYCELNNLKMNDWVSDKIIELTKNYTYVEIAPRGSGKTTRLVNAIDDYINSGLKGLPIVVVTPNALCGNIIKDRLDIRDVNIDDIIFSDTMHIRGGKEHYQYFVDEFDHIDRDKLFISNSGYYCSTLKNSEGDDFTKELYQTYLNSVLWRK